MKTFWQWLRGKHRQAPITKQPRRVKPWAEALEDRWCPAHGSLFTWDPPLNHTDLNWSDPNNWCNRSSCR